MKHDPWWEINCTLGPEGFHWLDQWLNNGHAPLYRFINDNDMPPTMNPVDGTYSVGINWVLAQPELRIIMTENKLKGDSWE